MVPSDNSAPEKPKAGASSGDDKQSLSPEDQLVLQNKFLNEYFQKPTSQLFKDITKASLIADEDERVTKLMEVLKTYGYDALDMEQIYEALNSRDDDPREPEKPGPEPEDPDKPKLPPDTQPIPPNALTPFNFEIYSGEYTYRTVPAQPLTGAYPIIQIGSDGQITMPDNAKYKAVNETDKEGRYWACWTVTENKEWYKIEFLRRWSETRKTKIKAFQGFHCTRPEGTTDVVSILISGECIDVDPLEKAKDKADADRRSEWWKASLAMGGVLTLYLAMKYAKKRWGGRNRAGSNPGEEPRGGPPANPGENPRENPRGNPGGDPPANPAENPRENPIGDLPENPAENRSQELQRLHEELKQVYEKVQQYASNLNRFEEVRAGQEIMDKTDTVERSTLMKDMTGVMDIEYNHWKQKGSAISDLQSPGGEKLLNDCRTACEAVIERWSKAVSDKHMASLDVQKRLLEGGSLSQGQVEASKRRIISNVLAETKGTFFGPGAPSKSLGLGYIEMKFLSEKYDQFKTEYLAFGDAYLEMNNDLTKSLDFVREITEKRSNLHLEISKKSQEMQKKEITELERKAIEEAHKSLEVEMGRLAEQLKTEKAKSETLAVQRDLAEQKHRELQRERDLKELEHKMVEEKHKRQAKELLERRFRKY
jgi:hypothetical protein